MVKWLHNHDIMMISMDIFVLFYFGLLLFFSFLENVLHLNYESSEVRTLGNRQLPIANSERDNQMSK